MFFSTPFLIRCAPQAGQLYSPAFTHSGAYREYDDAKSMALSPMKVPITIDGDENYIVSDILSESQPILPRYGLQRGYGDFTPNGLPTSLKLLPQVRPSLSSIFQSC